MTDTSLEFATIRELATRIRAGALSPVTLAETRLERIAALDKRLHAFIATTADRQRAMRICGR